MNDKPETAVSPAKPEFRGRVYDSIVDTVGATPLVRLAKLAADEGVDDFAAFPSAKSSALCARWNPRTT